MKKIEEPIVKVVKMQVVDIVTGSGDIPTETNMGYDNFQQGTEEGETIINSNTIWN